MTMQAQPAVSIVPHSLQAVLDKQAGQPHAFRVTVDIELDADWTVELAPSVPQGINPLIKLLRFKVACRQGAGGSAVARRRLRYDETPPAASYAEVWLGDGDMAISARVTIIT